MTELKAPTRFSDINVSSLEAGGSLNSSIRNNFDVEANNVHLLRIYHRDGERPRDYPPPKTTCVALTLFVLGFIFLIAGLSVYFGPPDSGRSGFPLMVIGGIMFIPGSYACVILFGAWRGWRGYDYNQIVAYDQE